MSTLSTPTCASPCCLSSRVWAVAPLLPLGSCEEEERVEVASPLPPRHAAANGHLAASAALAPPAASRPAPCSSSSCCDPLPPRLAAEPPRLAKPRLSPCTLPRNRPVIPRYGSAWRRARAREPRAREPQRRRRLSAPGLHASPRQRSPPFDPLPPLPLSCPPFAPPPLRLRLPQRSRPSVRQHARLRFCEPSSSPSRVLGAGQPPKVHALLCARMRRRACARFRVTACAPACLCLLRHGQRTSRKWAPHT